MSIIKKILMAVTVIGIAGLGVLGVTEIDSLVTLGVTIGTIAVSLGTAFKKD